MAKQRPWDKHEAAILLDAVIRVRSGELEKKQAIVDVSEKLRRKAQTAGFEIDNVYRNVAGITFQMHSMESAYVGHADFVLITHDHYDHFSPEDIGKVSKADTILVVPEKMAAKAREEVEFKIAF